MDLTAMKQKELFRSMLRIRKVQERIEAEYPKDEMKTPVHLCIGQEAVAVGVCSRLEPEDYICSNHRGHGHYLAKGGNLRRLVAELYCRRTGCSGGRGGSMHLVDTSVGHIGSSAIVGGGIPIAAGLALALRMRREDRVSVAFFSDGAVDEGVLYESVNFALLRRLPVIFVYENNQYSCCSKVTDRQAGRVVFHYLPAEVMFTAAVDGNSVKDVWKAAGEGVALARSGQGPAFIECLTYRVRGHAGSGTDAGLGYRSAEEIGFWEARCPIESLRKELLEAGITSPEELLAMNLELDREIDDAFRFARESPLPGSGELHNHLFSED